MVMITPVEYVNPGNQDSRNKTVYAASNASWDVGFMGWKIID